MKVELEKAIVEPRSLKLLLEITIRIFIESVLTPDAAEAPPEVRAELAEQRDRARADRNFEAADELRGRIEALGWEVRDGAAGFELLAL